jgi:hypothetical protein
MHLVDLALSDKPIGQVPLRFPMTGTAVSPGAADDLCLAAEIPMAKITERAGKNAEINVLVFNDKDDIVFERGSVEELSSIAGETVHIMALASAPPGRYRCRIIVRSLETGAAAVAAATTIVPLPKDKGLQLYSPLFLKLGRGSRTLKEFLPKASSGRTQADFISTALMFDMLHYIPLTEKTLKMNSDIWASIRCAFAGSQARDIRLTAFLYDKQTQNQIPVPLTVVAKKDGAGTTGFFVNLKIPEVEPDEYRFCFVAVDPATNELAMTVADFIIE